ncbi:MAG: hypothetical protein J5816_03060 [Clostridia bacterium]|nr:hypothetical protein [Clostridia bacterium]
MKNRKLFTVIAILCIMIAVSVPFFADVFYDQDNGALYASTWTYWDTDQPAMSIPYLDVNTTVMGINNTHDIAEVRTVVVVFGGVCNYFDHNSYGNFTDYHYPVPAADASLYHSEIAYVHFQ